jgi:hypothetical protein
VLRVLDITEMSAIVAAAGVLVGVAYYILDMRQQRQVSQTEFIMNMPSTFLKKEMFETLATLRRTEFKSYDDFERECGLEARQVAGFCEDLGLLVKRKLVDISLVADRYDVNDVYEKLKPWIEEMRKRANNQRLFEWFEYLYNEVKKREQKLQ